VRGSVDAVPSLPHELLCEHVRSEAGEVADPFALPHEFDGQTRLLLDRQDEAALRRAVELRQHKPGNPRMFNKRFGLREPVLSGRCVEHEQHFRHWRELLHDSSDLSKLIHETALGLQPPRGIDDRNIVTLVLSALYRLKSNRRGILSLLLRLHNIHARARGPGRELLDGRGTERVGRTHDDLLVEIRQVPRELSDCRRLTDAVHTHHEHDRGSFGEIERRVVRGQPFFDRVAKHPTHFLHLGDAVPFNVSAELIENRVGDLRSEVGGDERRFKFIPGVIGDEFGTAEQVAERFREGPGSLSHASILSSLAHSTAALKQHSRKPPTYAPRIEGIGIDATTFRQNLVQRSPDSDTISVLQHPAASVGTRRSAKLHGGTVTLFPTRPGLTRRRFGAVLFLLTVLFSIAGLLVPSPASAVDCAPAPDTGCLQGIIRSSDGAPLEGVTIDLAGQAVEETTSTDANGRWSFAVTTAGSYTVSVDAASLPDGQFPKGVASRELEVALYDSASALFPLTDDPAEAASDEPADEAGGQQEPGSSAESSPATPPAASSDFSWSRFWQQFASGIRMGLLLSLAALGLSLVYGTTGVSNFAQGEMISMGGMLAFLFMSLTGNLWLAGLITFALMAAFGYVQDMSIWKPMRRRRLSLMQMMIVSIGFSIALQNVFQFFFGASILRIDTRTPETVTILGVTLTVQSYVAMGIALLAVIAVGLALKYTRFGRATRAVADNPALAEASGIKVDQVIRVVWTVGTALAGLAGVLLGLVLNGIAWNTGWSFLLLLFAAVVLGGIGTAFGAFVGAMIIGLVVEMANIWLPGDLKHAAALFILIIVLLVRPQGIFGRKERIG